MMGIDSGRLFRIIAPFLPSVTPSSVDSVCGRSDDVLVHRTKGEIKRKPTELRGGGFQPKMQSGREKENAASSTRLNRAKQEIAVLCLTRSTSVIRRASCIIAGAKLDLVRERATDADASLHEQNPAPPL